MEQLAKHEAVDAIIKEAIQEARADESVSFFSDLSLQKNACGREEQVAKKRRKKQECQEAADFQAIRVAAHRAKRARLPGSLSESPMHIRTSMEKVIFNRYMQSLKEDPTDEHWDELTALYNSLSDYAHVFPKAPFMLMNYYYTEWKESLELVLSEDSAKAESFFEKQFYPTPCDW